MARELVLGALATMSPALFANAWSHPLSDTAGFATLPHWQRMARVVEAAGFDFLFFADSPSYSMAGDRIPDAVVEEGVNFPTHDPIPTVAALAATVPRLAFGVTASTTLEAPVMHARRFTTLDHLTEGRVGWNIVNSDMQHALVRLHGLRDITPHGERYDRADEFMSVMYELWEASWEDGAVLFDKATRRFAEPSKVHRVRHDGKYFSVDGLFPAIPSPQRTPVLLQAGSSSRGIAFAGEHAEIVFAQEAAIDRAADFVSRLRAAALAAGRSPHSLAVINSLSVVVGDTEQEARRLRRELRDTPSTATMAAGFLAWTGIDLLSLPPSSTLNGIVSDYGQGTLAHYQGEDAPTVADILDGLRDTIGGFKVTGTPESVARQLEEIVDGSDLDGFMVEETFGGPEPYEEFGRRVVPLLRRDGYLPDQPRNGTFRERLPGSTGARLSGDHPGARRRRPETGSTRADALNEGIANR